jgi:hypothetical protein
MWLTTLIEGLRALDGQFDEIALRVDLRGVDAGGDRHRLVVSLAD